MVRVRKSVRGDEIGVEDGDHFAGGGLQPFLKRARFEPVPVRPVMVLDRVAKRAIAFHQRVCKGRVSSVESSSTWICSNSLG